MIFPRLFLVSDLVECMVRSPQTTLSTKFVGKVPLGYECSDPDEVALLQSLVRVFPFSLHPTITLPLTTSLPYGTILEKVNKLLFRLDFRSRSNTSSRSKSKKINFLYHRTSTLSSCTGRIHNTVQSQFYKRWR